MLIQISFISPYLAQGLHCTRYKQARSRPSVPPQLLGSFRPPPAGGSKWRPRGSSLRGGPGAEGAGGGAAQDGGRAAASRGAHPQAGAGGRRGRNGSAWGGIPLLTRGWVAGHPAGNQRLACYGGRCGALRSFLRAGRSRWLTAVCCSSWGGSRSSGSTGASSGPCGTSPPRQIAATCRSGPGRSSEEIRMLRKRWGGEINGRSQARCQWSHARCAWPPGFVAGVSHRGP